MSFDQLDTLNSLLRDVDEQQTRIDALKADHPDAYKRILDIWAVESTYNSNNIEGSTLSLGDTALLYEGADVNAPLREIKQAEGGFAALRFLQEVVEKGHLSSQGESAPLLTEKTIKRAHELLFAEALDSSTRGTYRREEVEITGTTFQVTSARYVQERMSSLVQSVNKSRRHAAITAALFHLEFESIHPFVNANGRTGRLVSNMILMKMGYEPVNIQAESRIRYIRTLRSFQVQDDPYPFVHFFCTNLFDRLKKIRGMLTEIPERAEEEVSEDVGNGTIPSRLDTYLRDEQF